MIPTLSIIVVTLNAGNTLEKALQSVVTQHYPHLELIVIDGGSQDNTIDIIKKYQSFITYWHSQPDRGGNDAYNIGIRKAQGDIIALLNADDWYEPNTLKKVADCYYHHRAPDVITCGARFITEDGKSMQEIIHRQQLQLTFKNVLFGSPLINARFFKKTFLEKIGTFQSHDKEDRYCISADRDLLLRAALQKPRQWIIPQIGYTYLIHEHSQTFSNKPHILKRVFAEHAVLCKKYLSQGSLTITQTLILYAWYWNQRLRAMLFHLKNFIKRHRQNRYPR